MEAAGRINAVGWNCKPSWGFLFSILMVEVTLVDGSNVESNYALRKVGW